MQIKRHQHFEKRFRQRGVSLIEAIVALTILSAIGVALVSLNVQIQSATNSARARSFSEAQAQKMIEQVRNQKNQGGGINSLDNGCYSDGTLTPPELSNCICNATGDIGGAPMTGNQSAFKTFVIISTVGTGKKVEANVGWKERNRNNCTKVVTVLYDY